MYRRVFIIGAVVIGLAVGITRAQEANATKTAVLSSTIDGTAIGPIVGACPAGGYAAICPSSTQCSCVTITGKISGKLAGNGPAVVNITLDSGSATTNILNSTCLPAFGTAVLTTTAGSGKNQTVRNETLNLNLSFCSQITNAASNTFDGGFGIAASPAPSPAANGWGSVNGTQNGSKVKLKLKGSITQ